MKYGTTSVVNVTHQVCDRMVDRTTKWGNPFRMRSEDDRAEALQAYLQHLQRRPDLVADVARMRGRRLGCWCAPKPCHGMFIALLAEGVPLDCLDLFL